MKAEKDNLDPVLFKLNFMYMTGHKERVLENYEHYNAEDGVYVRRKTVTSEYIHDELLIHYSGRITVADKENVLKDLPDFRLEYESFKDFIFYIAETDILHIEKRDDHHIHGFRLVDEGDIDIHSHMISRRYNKDWNINRLEISYRFVKSDELHNIDLKEYIPYEYLLLSFGRWLYNVDKTLDCEKVYDIAINDYMLLHPDWKYSINQDWIDNIEQYEKFYTGYCSYDRHKQDKEIEKAERALEELKRKKMSNTVAGFNIG